MSRLTEMLRRHEGVESHAYMCSQNFWTIGVGRNVDPGDNGAAKGLGLSDDEIDYLLSNDIKRVEKELSDEYEWFFGLDDVAQVQRYIQQVLSIVEYYRETDKAKEEDNEQTD